jgi:DNA-binding NarL/FixJ family response regulator
VRAVTARAAVTLATGDAGRAAELAAAAVAQADEIEDLLDGVKARLLGASALDAAGRRGDAVAELRRAAELAARGSAGKLGDQIARALRGLGESAPRVAPPRAVGADGFGLLTEREREISELVAQGQSNKEVAAALFLSEKTVEKHLSRAFGKLGVRSRGELAAAFARRGD